MSPTLGALTMVLSIASTGLLVDWVARAKHPRRLFLLDLGRERTKEDEARARRLRIGNALITAAGIALVFGPDWLAPFGITGAPLLSATWLVVESVGAARSAKREHVPGRFMVSLDAPPGVLEYVSAPLAVLNVLVVVVPCALFAWTLSQLPARVPVHWNAAGEVDRYASPNELWMWAGILTFDLALLWVIVFGIAKERWALPENEPERYRALQFERRRLLVRMLEWVMLGVDAGLAIIWMGLAFGTLHGIPDSIPVVAGAVLTLGGTLVPFFIYVPRIVRTVDELRRIAGTAVLGTHDSGWVFDNLIYYAPEDPAVFVPKRSGIGQTLNMARPAAWAFLIAVIALPIVISLAATLLVD